MASPQFLRQLIWGIPGMEVRSSYMTKDCGKNDGHGTTPSFLGGRDLRNLERVTQTEKYVGQKNDWGKGTIERNRKE
jgi:hypothetical protein